MPYNDTVRLIVTAIRVRGDHGRT